MSLGLWVVGAFLFGKVLGYYVGARNARSAERDRCVSLLHQSSYRPDGRNSGTVLWVMHSVLAGHRELVPADKFGLPPPKERSAPATIYCKGCGDGMEPDPIPELCVGCVNEALQRGVDPDPEQLRMARIEQDVHLCLWSSQPDILIACDHSWTTPKWGPKQPLPDNIYYADDGRMYTFDEELTTCKACQETAADPVKRAAAGTP